MPDVILFVAYAPRGATKALIDSFIVGVGGVTRYYEPVSSGGPQRMPDTDGAIDGDGAHVPDGRGT